MPKRITEEEVRELQKALSTVGINPCDGPHGHAWDSGLEDPKPDQVCMCGRAIWTKKDK